MGSRANFVVVHDGRAKVYARSSEHGNCLGVRIHGLDRETGEPWEAGPSLLDRVREQPELGACDWFPMGGIHLDEPTRTAGLWTTQPLCGLEEDWPDLWPGWTLTFCPDGPDEQAALCAGRFTPPDVDVRSGLAAVITKILGD